MSAFAAAGAVKTTGPSPFAEITGANRTFADPGALGLEILRLKAAASAPGHTDEIRAALRQQIVMRQAEWVTKAKAAGLEEPSGRLDPFRATPADVANALLWSEAGGVIPRDELAKDGGRAFLASVRDAVALRTRGFDALLALHDGNPAEQQELLAKELTLRGVRVPANATLDSLRALYGESTRHEEATRPSMGLDGRAGTAEAMGDYEREQRLAALHPGSTLGSMMVTYSAFFFGPADVERMRALGNAGNAAEGMCGGAGVHTNMVANARQPPGEVKANHDDFNRTGLIPRFRLKPMNTKYSGEQVPGNDVWNANRPSKPRTVEYAARPSDRAKYNIEARPVMIDGKREMRLFDAEGNLFDTRQAAAHDGAPRAIFVMNSQGDFYASTFQEVAYMHHSSLSGGEPVGAAGELMVENGKVVGITNRSGHYRPGPQFMEQAIRGLEEKGLDLTGVKVVTYGADGSPSARRVMP